MTYSWFQFRTIEDTFDNPGYTSLMKIFPGAVADAGIWKCAVSLQDFTGALESSTATVTVSGELSVVLVSFITINHDLTQADCTGYNF